MKCYDVLRILFIMKVHLTVKFYSDCKSTGAVSQCFVISLEIIKITDNCKTSTNNNAINDG